jgi:MinD superfamily P-loop ATPase
VQQTRLSRDRMGAVHAGGLLCDGCNQCPPLCKFLAILERKD